MNYAKHIFSIKKILPFAFILIVFNSCTIGGAYYFVNNSNQTITFIQHLKDYNNEINFHGITDSDRKFNRRTHKHLETLPIQIDSVNQFVEIFIPPKKAILFDVHRNSSYLISKKIQLKIDNQLHELDDLKLKYRSKGFLNVTIAIHYK